MNHDNEENFFPRIERSRMVYDILARTPYDREESTKFLKNRQSFFVGHELFVVIAGCNTTKFQNNVKGPYSAYALQPLIVGRCKLVP